MSVSVTLTLFSGRPNPTWVLGGEQAQELALRLRSAPGADNLSKSLVGGLGYHGFLILPSADEVDPLLVHPLRVYGGTVDFGEHVASRVDTERSLERWLVSLAPLVDAPTQARVNREFGTIYGDPHCRAREASASELPGRPVYNPALWSGAGVRSANNCYSYANDLFTFTAGDHATPGESAGAPVVAGTCQQFRHAATMDKLKRLTTLPVDGAPIALFVSSDQTDYHWYRQDASGFWSHKPGGWQVRDCDESGYAITDPRTANVLDYQFCAFFNTGPKAKGVIK